MECTRLVTEQNEARFLSPRAALAVNSRGRKSPEPPCELRTCYQRDRDRVIHSKAFRRLKHKTQVFLSPESDHYRTRLTHTLEVAQIARTIARALRLNEDLTEAIALAHDLGHTPFGHAGERALAAISATGFTHYEQSVRVCEVLEKDGKGLNLTYEVLDGVLHHTCGEQAQTLEGRIVRLADRVAYINHDIDDAIRAGVISASDIPRDITAALGDSKSRRIHTLVTSIVQNSGETIEMDAETAAYCEDLHRFLFESVYTNPTAKFEETKVAGIIEGLYHYFMAHPEALTAESLQIAEREGKERAVLDHIAGMTDHYAITTYSNIFIPKAWSI